MHRMALILKHDEEMKAVLKWRYKDGSIHFGIRVELPHDVELMDPRIFYD
jgi:hypothetical protein